MDIVILTFVIMVLFLKRVSGRDICFNHDLQMKWQNGSLGLLDIGAVEKKS